MPTSPEHSADVPDAFLATLIADCSPAGLGCRPLDLVACWLHESGLSPHALNASGHAAGFFQAMPATLRDLGFKGDEKYREPAGAHPAAVSALARAKVEHPEGGSEVAAAHAELGRLDQALANAFCRLSLEGQLVWAYRYYLPHRGQLVNAGACYAANFTPGLLAHAGDSAFVICASNGRASWALDRDPALARARSQEWYRVNISLDADNDGAITMGDLAATAAGALRSARAQELATRLRRLAGEALDQEAPEEEPESTLDVTDGGADRPVYMAPDTRTPTV